MSYAAVGQELQLPPQHIEGCPAHQVWAEDLQECLDLACPAGLMPRFGKCIAPQPSGGPAVADEDERGVGTVGTAVVALAVGTVLWLWWRSA